MIFVSVRLWGLTDFELWYDEVWSVEAARLGWKELVLWIANDAVHPPLFYFLLKLWMKMGGESLLWLKSFPFLTGCAAVIPGVSFCAAN